MRKKIAIIGGGIAGLSFAHCLSKEKYDINIFEKKKVFGEVGAAISVFPNALDVIDKIAAVETGPADKPVEDVPMTFKVERISKDKITKNYGYTYPE